MRETISVNQNHLNQISLLTITKIVLFKEYCILPFYQNRANQGIVINKKSSYCKDRANQGRLNQGLTVCIL